MDNWMDASLRLAQRQGREQELREGRGWVQGLREGQGQGLGLGL